MKQSKKVAILGAGISGLSLAWYLSKEIDPSEIVLIEKGDQLGGWMQTTIEDGFLFERGPRTFRPSKSTDLLDLIEEVGILDQVIAASNVAQMRYILNASKLQPVPRNPIDFFTSPLTRGIVPALFKEWLVPTQNLEDESIYDFVSRRLNRKTALKLFDPLTVGIYAGDIKNLSMKSCFPALFELEQNSGTITRGLIKSLRRRKKKDRFVKEGFHRSSLFTLRYGMGSLVEMIERKLEIEIRKSTEVESLSVNSEGVQIQTSSGEIEVEQVFCALPLPGAGKLLQNLDSSFTSLSQVKNASLMIANLGYDQKVLEKKGFGYLVPSEEKDEILGMIWDSDVFPEQNLGQTQTRLSVMMGGMFRPDILDLSSEECFDRAKSAASRHLKIDIEPKVQILTKALNCIPQLEVGHHQKMTYLQKRLAELYPQLHLVGNYIDGVSVNDCIARSKEVCRAFSSLQATI